MAAILFKLNDPVRAKHRTELLNNYRNLAQEALRAEGLNDPTLIDKLSGELAEISLLALQGVFPGTNSPKFFAKMKQDIEGVRSEGERVQRRLDELVEAINSASLDVHTELANTLKERGLGVSDLNTVLEALSAAAGKISETKIPTCCASVKQGRNPDPLHSWITQIWPWLNPHLSMKAAGRICSRVFTGSDQHSETFYQTIRNAIR